MLCDVVATRWAASIARFYDVAPMRRALQNYVTELRHDVARQTPNAVEFFLPRFSRILSIYS